MMTLLTIKKIRDDLFETTEYDPNDPENESKWNVLNDFERLGMIMDVESGTRLSVGSYPLVFKKFKNLETKYKASPHPDFADTLRIYDISECSPHDVDWLLKNSTHGSVIVKKYKNLPVVKGSSFDDAEVIDSTPLS